MSTTSMLRVFFAIVFTLLLTGALFYRSLHDPDEDTDKPRYLPLFPSLLLPGVLVSLAVLFLWRTGPEKTADAMLSICFPIFLQICLYQLVLLLLLPLLRR